MQIVHEFSMEEAADLIDAGAINARGDRWIRVLDLCSGPGGVGRAPEGVDEYRRSSVDDGQGQLTNF